MKALVLHPYPRFGVGGTSVVAVEAARALKKLGLVVHFATYDKPDCELFRRMAGFEPDMLFTEFGRSLASPSYAWVGGIFGSFYKLDYDYVVNAIYDHLAGFADLGYVHYPRRVPATLRQIRRNPYALGSLLLDRLFCCRAKTIAANSGWTARKVEEAFGVRPQVIYPPVKACGRGGEEKERLVVGLGRISPEKRWEDFVEVALRVKQRSPQTHFMVLGANYSDGYLEALRRTAKNVVEFRVNVSEKEKWAVLASSAVILHTAKGEHFGIAVAEAMSCGAIPVVYTEGGVWEDIVERGRFGYGYAELEEACEAVLQALDDTEMGRAVRLQAKKFSDEAFQLKVLRALGLQ